MSDTASTFSCPRYDELPEVELYMDQVVSLLDIKLAALADEDEKIATGTMINNYVKQHVIAPPNKKKYDRSHIAQLIIIFLMKRVFSISEIKILLSVINASDNFEDAYNRFAEEIDNVIAVTFDRTADGIKNYIENSGSGYGGVLLDDELISDEDRLELIIKSSALAFACKMYAQRVLRSVKTADKK